MRFSFRCKCAAKVLIDVIDRMLRDWNDPLDCISLLHDRTWANYLCSYMFIEYWLL